MIVLSTKLEQHTQNFSISRHTVVCPAAQEAGAPHREYINRKKLGKRNFHTYVAL